jgi:hypothetical protein
MRLIAILFLGTCLAWPQPPSPSNPKQDVKSSADDNPRGTVKSPVVVRLLPSPQTGDEPTIVQSKGGNQSTDWWMFGITLIIALIGAIQTRVFWIQAQRLEETIDKMEEISSRQTADIQASLAETTKAASAMQRIAESMAISVESVKVSVGINREIADRQKLITELQSRAYLTVVFEGVVPQNAEAGLRFEPRMKIVNRGNTPAANVRYSALADVLAFPLREDFAFPVPELPRGHSSPIGPGLEKIISAVVPRIYPEVERAQICKSNGQRIIMWGTILYEDGLASRGLLGLRLRSTKSTRTCGFRKTPPDTTNPTKAKAISPPDQRASLASPLKLAIIQSGLLHPAGASPARITTTVWPS